MTGKLNPLFSISAAREASTNAEPAQQSERRDSTLPRMLVHPSPSPSPNQRHRGRVGAMDDKIELNRRITLITGGDCGRCQSWFMISTRCARLMAFLRCEPPRRVSFPGRSCGPPIGEAAIQRVGGQSLVWRQTRGAGQQSLHADPKIRPTSREPAGRCISR